VRHPVAGGPPGDDYRGGGGPGRQPRRMLALSSPGRTAAEQKISAVGAWRWLVSQCSWDALMTGGGDDPGRENPAASGLGAIGAQGVITPSGGFGHRGDDQALRCGLFERDPVARTAGWAVFGLRKRRTTARKLVVAGPWGFGRRGVQHRSHIGGHHEQVAAIEQEAPWGGSWGRRYQGPKYRRSGSAGACIACRGCWTEAGVGLHAVALLGQALRREWVDDGFIGGGASTVRHAARRGRLRAV
jgi:hypothetical protein